MYPEKSIRLNAFQANIPFLYLPKTIKPDIFYFLEDIEREHWPEIGQLSKGFTAKYLIFFLTASRKVTCSHL